jgi:hypothetical protein
VFLILVAKAPAPVWKVERSASGVIANLEKKAEYVKRYEFHVINPRWGHVVIKRSGHPPFGAQVFLNGHEYVACAVRAAGIRFAKEDNCWNRGSAGPGSDGRYLVAACGYRAAEPGCAAGSTRPACASP